MRIELKKKPLINVCDMRNAGNRWVPLDDSMRHVLNLTCLAPIPPVVRNFAQSELARGVEIAQHNGYRFGETVEATGYSEILETDHFRFLAIAANGVNQSFKGRYQHGQVIVCAVVRTFDHTGMVDFAHCGFVAIDEETNVPLGKTTMFMVGGPDARSRFAQLTKSSQRFLNQFLQLADAKTAATLFKTRVAFVENITMWNNGSHPGEAGAQALCQRIALMTRYFSCDNVILTLSGDSLAARYAQYAFLRPFISPTLIGSTMEFVLLHNRFNFPTLAEEHLPLDAAVKSHPLP